MKNNLLKNTFIAGALCTVLAIPSFAQQAKFDHWAKVYREQLLTSYNTEAIFKEKDLDAAISVEDFKNLVKLILDEKYDSAPDAMTREAVVYELTKIWAEKTEQDLDNIAVIKMLIYSDTDQIDMKYNHNITVAYMRDIAQGKGPGIFDPKANVTYGEVATLMHNTYKAIENEMKSTPPSIVKGKFETRGSYEIKEDKVVFDFELMSHYTETQRLQFGSGQQFEVIMTDDKGKEVYKYSDGKSFTLALVIKDINPGQTLKWQDEWDMTNKEGEKLTSGKYKAQIKIIVIPEENGEKIEENELVTVIDFNL